MLGRPARRGLIAEIYSMRGEIYIIQYLDGLSEMKCRWGRRSLGVKIRYRQLATNQSALTPRG